MPAGTPLAPQRKSCIPYFVKYYAPFSVSSADNRYNRHCFVRGKSHRIGGSELCLIYVLFIEVITITGVCRRVCAVALQLTG